MSKPIVLVGPIAPYRGGIAQYNTALFREFVANYGTGGLCFSFSRQYPAWLYPGNSDLDPGMPDYREPEVRYSLDSINPLTWLKTVREIARQDPGMVVFHWWTIFFLPCFLSMTFLLKRRGIPVTLICHNLADHDANALKSLVSKAMLSMADGFVVHSREHERAIAASHPGRPVVRYPIPSYTSFPRALGGLTKRGRLELLFFGFIRPYKGLDLLIDALAELQDNQVYLTVVGEPWGNSEELVREAATAPNIELHLGYNSDAQVAEYFYRADFIVLPYRTATGSAVASVASFYETPILATRVGGLPDVVIEGATGLLIPPNDVAALKKAIRTMNRALASKMSTHVREAKGRDSWASAVENLTDLAQKL